MKKTIKIIDLLKDYANGKVYENICYKQFNYRLTHGDYYSESLDKYLLADELCDLTNLNDEVEILDEEEFEDIKPLVLRTFERTGQAITTDRLEDYCDYNFEMIENTIAKMVLNQKKIIEMLKESE